MIDLILESNTPYNTVSLHDLYVYVLYVGPQRFIEILIEFL